MLGCIIGMLLETKFKTFSLGLFQDISDIESISFHHTHVKLLSSILVFFLITRDCIVYRHFGCFTGLLGKLSNQIEPINEITASGPSWWQKLAFLLSKCILWIFLINSALIVIINPSLLNPGPSSSLKIVSFNCQGLIPFSELNSDHPQLDITKIHEINAYIEINKPDILMLNETWLKKSIKKGELFPVDTFKIFRLDRTPKTHPPDPSIPNKFRKNGGGVLIAIRRDLDIESTRLEFQCAGEILGLTLKFSDGRKLVVCSYYRVGTLGTANHNEFKEYIRRARSRRGVIGIVVVGDLNMPKIDWELFSSTESIDQLFLDSFSNFELEQLINTPTHKHGNILDLLLTDKSALISDISVSDINMPCKSDHYSISFTIKSNFKRLKIPKREVYNFKRANWTALKSDLNSINWNDELDNDVEIAWANFKTILFNLMDQHIPKIKIGGLNQPSWFDAETHQLCRDKERLHQVYKDTVDPDLKLNRYLKFSLARKQFKNLVNKKLSDSFEDEEDSALITKKFWAYVKASANSTRIPEVVHFEETFKSSPLDQATLFNSFFYKQFSEDSNYDIDIDDSRSDEYLIDFSEHRICDILKNLNPNKAIGPDKIHGIVLKNCSRSLAKPLAFLFSKSYTSGTLPKEWKSALVVPVHKKGSKADVENYRPISLTCIIVKVMERIVRDELMTHCGHLIDPRQHGFLRNKSCTTQLIDFCDSLALSLNNNLRSDVIYFDFAKAFDSVNHDLILIKLKSIYKIDSSLLRFISEYLKGRTQRVVIGGSMSSELPVLSGVPQGSIIGPTLFVLFLNDIVHGLDTKTNILMYADDTKIWRQMNDSVDHITLQHDIDYLHNWALRNKMKFHPSKCKVLMVSKLNPPFIDVLPCIQYFYTLGNTLLDYTQSEKDLGITINRTLNFSEHTDSLYNRANQRFGLLKRTCHFVDNNAKRRVLYLTMVRSIFEHCPVVWRPSANTAIHKLESIQKRAVKWINQDFSISYSNNDLLYYSHCKQLNIFPVRFRFDFHDLKLFHLIIYKFSCIKLPSYLHFFEGRSRLRFTHLDNLSLVSDISSNSINTTTKRGFANSYFYRTHLLWNRLPLHLREIVRPSEFKTKLIDFIWRELVIVNDDHENDAFLF